VPASKPNVGRLISSQRERRIIPLSLRQ